MIVSDLIPIDKRVEIYRIVTVPTIHQMMLGTLILGETKYKNYRCIETKASLMPHIEYLIRLLNSAFLEIVAYNRQGGDCSMMPSWFEKKLLVIPDHISNEIYLEVIMLLS